MRTPPFGRAQGFTRAMELLDKKRNPVIVEYGTTNQYGNWLEDGYSTALFGWYVTRFGGNFTSIDTDPRSARLCERIFSEHDIPTTHIDLATADGTAYIQSFTKGIDLLYLDAKEYPLANTDDALAQRITSEQMHLEFFLAAEPHLNEKAIVMIDDCFDTRSWKGKGRRLIPYLTARHYTVDPVSFIAQEYHHPSEIYQYLCLKP